MTKQLAIALLAATTLVFAQQVQTVITTSLDTHIDFVGGTTSFTYRVSVPNPFGSLPDQQLGDSRTYAAIPDAATLSNDLLQAGINLLLGVGANTNNVTVVLPK